MGGVELGKSFFGRDSLAAWVTGAIIPGGVFGIWRRCPYKGLRSTIFFALVGLAYQHSTNMNYENTFFMPNTDNPNLPRASNVYSKDFSFWDVSTKGTKNEWSDLPERMGWQAADPGPSWKKWEDAEKK